MKRFAEICFGIVFAAGFWLWTGAKVVLDWMGRGVVVNDLAIPDSTAAHMLRWFFSTPWYVPAFLAAVLTCVAAYLLLRNASPQKVASSPKSSSISSSSGSWLEAIATKDDQDMAGLVHVRRRQIRSQLDVVSPYIDIEYSFINGSVFEIVVKELIGGRILYLGAELQERPDLHDDNRAGTGIGHGIERSVVIRQWVNADIAARMMFGEGANITEGRIDLVTDRMALCFSYVNLRGETKEVRKLL